MENSAKENTTENQSNTTPKPSEDVQLTIETVTPDTEKDVVPTQVQQDSSNENGSKSDADEQKPGTAAIENTSDTDSAKEEKESTETESNGEEATDEPESDQETTLDDDDERNQIETVSP